MAFNLNKNDEAKRGSSTFNLSKQAAQTVEPVKQLPSSANTWIVGIIGIIVIGAGIWYYSSSKESPSPASDSVKVAPVNAEVEDSAVSIPTSETATVEKPNNKKATVTTTLAHKVPVNFAKGSSTFLSMDQSLIARIISYLKENPDASIQVSGYASSDGSLAVNQIISQARADAFKKFLISKSISESRIIAIGRGIENPIASNENNLGRKKNRRTEVSFP